MRNIILNVSVEDGKYTVQQDDKGKLLALRHGEPWRDCTGDKLVYALATRVEELERDRDMLDWLFENDCVGFEHTAHWQTSMVRYHDRKAVDMARAAMEGKR